MKKGFEIIDHTADVGIHVWGKSYNDIFKNAAVGMVCLLIDIRTVLSKEERIIKIEAEDEEELLLKWLREILFLIEQNGMVFSEFHIKKDNFAYKNLHKYVFYCSLGGEKIDPERHNICREIKAVTRYGFYIKRKVDLWEARIFFDV